MTTYYIIGKLPFFVVSLREEVGVFAFSTTSFFKVNVDGAAKGKPNPMGIGVVRNDKWEVLVIVPKYEGIKVCGCKRI